MPLMSWKMSITLSPTWTLNCDPVSTAPPPGAVAEDFRSLFASWLFKAESNAAGRMPWPPKAMFSTTVAATLFGALGTAGGVAGVVDAANQELAAVHPTWRAAAAL